MPAPTPYIADTPRPFDREELRRRIPGWGVDLDPADRPSVPQERAPRPEEGVHWDFPEAQPDPWERERSIEHEILTPVFGTSCPPAGLAGAVRRAAYRRYSEARAAHWVLLLLADRIDAWGHHLRSFASRRPDNPLTQTGIKTELTAGGLRSRRGRKRADTKHQLLDPLIVGGPWVLGGIALWRRLRRSSALSGRSPRLGRG